MLDELRRIALFSSGVAELTRHQAEQIVKDLVRKGDVRRQQASDVVKDLLETSRQSRKELARLVRSEIQNQIEGLGLVTKRDIERLERRVTRLEGSGKGSGRSAAKSTATRKTPAPRKTAAGPKKTTSKSGS